MAFYKLTPSAYDDLNRIYLYGLKRFGEKQADLYYHALIDQFEKLAINPLHYPSDETQKGYRRCVFRQDVIYYRQMDDFIEITTILGRQNHNDWL